jgi:hypothetical protein
LRVPLRPGSVLLERVTASYGNCGGSCPTRIESEGDSADELFIDNSIGIWYESGPCASLDQSSIHSVSRSQASPETSARLAPCSGTKARLGPSPRSSILVRRRAGRARSPYTQPFTPPSRPWAPTMASRFISQTTRASLALRRTQPLLLQLTRKPTLIPSTSTRRDAICTSSTPWRVGMACTSITSTSPHDAASRSTTSLLLICCLFTSVSRLGLCTLSHVYASVLGHSHGRAGRAGRIRLLR